MFIIIGKTLEKGVEEKCKSVAKQFGGKGEVIYFEPPFSQDRFTLVNECRELVNKIRKETKDLNPVSIVDQSPHILYFLSRFLEGEGYPLFSILPKGKMVQYA